MRISGPKSLKIGEKLARRLLVPREALLANFHSADGEVLDQGILLYYRAPGSYTGEEVVELQAHGSPVVLAMLLERCVELGARLARPGEFSERAFLNGKLDLVQAEAVADLIASGSRMAARAAMRSLRGEFSRLVEQLDSETKRLRAEIEASIDFADEAEDFIDAGDIGRALGQLRAEVSKVLEEAKRGQHLRQRPRLVLAGAPNVGKSSILNRLAGHERAIVSEEPGTTRDLIHEIIQFAGMEVEVVDTAGLRESRQAVEAEGVKRAGRAMAEADLRIDIWDAARPETRGVWPDAQAGQARLEVINKVDLLAESASLNDIALAISAKTGSGVSGLRQEIEAALGGEQGEPAFLARSRHLASLDRCQEHVDMALREHERGAGAELVAEELRGAHRALGEIAGYTTAEDLLSEIFSSFCLGK